MNDLSHTKDTRYQRGTQLFEEVTGLSATEFTSSLDNIAPRFARYVMEWEFADMIGESSLDAKTREIVAITSLAMQGATSAPILKLRIGTALAAGVTRQEIIDTFIQLAVACGFPTALAAIHVAQACFSEFDAK
ncbi:carboxymuconolactone decarboxylase family protein [Burkholderia anthina]|uniref:carboxymuconolactone decarboxylase family protein n=1 Tax=Burkholderia anthina TaxID=179879 RepID=UPI00075F1B1E|nr:carboxymuconolactone decarboxylase family protein [Burkholderia anthina]KVN53109.1 carboxymuconolactone decarboxylase [Burkholderia anthina]